MSLSDLWKHTIERTPKTPKKIIGRSTVGDIPVYAEMTKLQKAVLTCPEDSIDSIKEFNRDMNTLRLNDPVDFGLPPLAYAFLIHKEAADFMLDCGIKNNKQEDTHHMPLSFASALMMADKVAGRTLHNNALLDISIDALETNCGLYECYKDYPLAENEIRRPDFKLSDRAEHLLADRPLAHIKLYEVVATSTHGIAREYGSFLTRRSRYDTKEIQDLFDDFFKLVLKHNNTTMIRTIFENADHDQTVGLFERYGLTEKIRSRRDCMKYQTDYSMARTLAKYIPYELAKDLPDEKIITLLENRQYEHDSKTDNLKSMERYFHTLIYQFMRADNHYDDKNYEFDSLARKVLLRSGVDLSARDTNGQTVLEKVFLGREVKEPSYHGMKIRTENVEMGEVYSILRQIRRILGDDKTCALVNAPLKDDKENTLLHVLAKKFVTSEDSDEREKHLNKAITLLQNGADVNAKNNLGETPLDITVTGGKYREVFNDKMTSLLLKHGGEYELFLSSDEMKHHRLSMLSHLLETTRLDVHNTIKNTGSAPVKKRIPPKKEF